MSCVQGIPMSEDYYISSYSECNWDSAKPAGVCPDSVFAGSTNSDFNNSQMLYGQQVDGIFIFLSNLWGLVSFCLYKHL
jgi:hypothetical protein